MPGTDSKIWSTEGRKREKSVRL